MSGPQPCCLAPGPGAVSGAVLTGMSLQDGSSAVLCCHQGCTSPSPQPGAGVLPVDGHCVLAFLSRGKVVIKGVLVCTVPAEPPIFSPGSCCVTIARTTRQKW